MQLATEVTTLTCICCPLGCQLEVSIDEEGAVEVTGYTCKRGADYAMREASGPERMVTAVIPAAGCLEPVSVKTAAPVPKLRVADVLEACATVQLVAPIEVGSVVIENVCGTGIDVVATKSIS